MKGLYKRHSVWWVSFTRLGTRYRVTTGESDESLAIVRARQIMDDPSLWEGSTASEDVGKFIAQKRKDGQRSKWVESSEMILNKFVRESKIKNVREITERKAIEWLDTYENPNTRFQRYTLLNQFAKYLVARSRITGNFCAGIKAKKPKTRVRRRFLSHDECKKLIDACTDPELKLAIQFGIYAGLRKGEILQIKPSWVDLDAGLLHVTSSIDWRPKREKDRTLPISAPLRQAIEAVGIREPWVVAPKKAGLGLYRWEFKDGFKSTVERAGLKDVVFHDLRRTFASLNVSAGVSIYKVAKWIGDNVETAEKHYGHLTPSDDDINKAWS